MDFFRELAVDDKKAREGVELVIGDATLIVASARTPEMKAYHQDLVRKHRHTLGAGGMASVGAQREIQARLCARLVRSWTGVTENGEPLECTPENVYRIAFAVELLSDQIYETASQVSGYQLSDDEDARGN